MVASSRFGDATLALLALLSVLLCSLLVDARMQSGHVPFDGSERARSHGLHFNPRQHVLDVVGDKHELIFPERVRGAARHELRLNRKGTVQHPERYEFKFKGEPPALRPRPCTIVRYSLRLRLPHAAFGKDFHLDVEKNSELLHPDYKVQFSFFAARACVCAAVCWSHFIVARSACVQDIVVHGDTFEVLSSKGRDEIEHCYFIGRVQGVCRPAERT